MPSVQAPSSTAISNFEKEFSEFRTEHASAIEQLEATVAKCGATDPLDNMLWEMVDDLKGLLGAAAANDCSDRATSQEDAIAAAESWVAQNTPDAVPLILWMKGIVEGSSAIADELRAA